MCKDMATDRLLRIGLECHTCSRVCSHLIGYENRYIVLFCDLLKLRKGVQRLIRSLLLHFFSKNTYSVFKNEETTEIAIAFH